MEDIIDNPVTREKITFLETAQTSGGKRSRFIVELRPGGTIRPHLHSEYDERIEVTQGIADVRIAGEHRRLQVGEHRLIMRGQAHAIWNASDEQMAFRVDVEPGHHGYETMLRVFFGVAREGGITKGGLPTDPRIIGLLSQWGNTVLPGFMRILQPLVGFLAFLGRGSGLEERLLSRYGEPNRKGLG